jgi:exodeoxyribonuclease VII large subunit
MDLYSATRAAETPARDIYTVSRLNREVRGLLEGSFPLIWIEGELSNVAQPSSGHIYFTLKDQNAQVRCAMFRNRNTHLRFRPQNGLQVLLRVRISLYEGRGEFQLIVEHMEEAGDGALRRAFEELKQRLAQEGLFDPAHKKELPRLPQRIGVITSPTGAAIRDILSVLRRRFPAIPVLIYPVPVQGEGAAAKIASAIRAADQRRDCDVLLVSRGGGSLEDLWAFNEEVVARAIYACQLPVVAGIGHEIDFTIADFVADHRAPTPSAAAELLSPDQGEWLQHLMTLRNRLYASSRTRLQQLTQRLQWLSRRLEQQHPGVRLRQNAQRLDELEQRLARAQRHRLRHMESTAAHLRARLQQHIPLHRIQQLIARCATLDHRAQVAMRSQLTQRRQKLTAVGRALDTVSPLATLDRGYAIVSRKVDGMILRDARDVKNGDQVEARLAKGVLICTVDETKEQ